MKAYDLDPFKEYYPFKNGSILNMVCATGLGYPLRERIPPECIFTIQDHRKFTRGCGLYGQNWELIAKFMGRPQYAIAAYSQFCDYVIGNLFMHGHVEHFKERGFTEKEIDYTIGLLYGLVLDGKWEKRFSKLWAALLEVEANGGVIPDALRKKLGGAAASSEEPETKPTTSTTGSKGSRKKAAKRARKAAKKAAAVPGGVGGQAAADKQSKYVGVNWHRVKGKWQIRLKKGGKDVLTGLFEDEEAAARAYDAGALLHIGPSAVVNFDGDTFLNPKAGAVVYGGIDGTVTSNYRGVRWHKTLKKWTGQISVNNKLLHLGSFDTPLEAALAYDEAAKQYHGSKAALNFDAEGHRTENRCRVQNNGKARPNVTRTPAATAPAAAPPTPDVATLESNTTVPTQTEDEDEDMWEDFKPAVHDDDDWEDV